VADEMQALAVVASRGGDIDRIGNQSLEGIVRKVGGIGPRLRRIAALIRRHGAVARPGQSGKSHAPAVSRFREPVQQQHERTAGRARDIRGECQARPGFYACGFDHRLISRHRWL
jgi:hypothetical protein